MEKVRHIAQKKSWINKIIIISFLVMLLWVTTNNFSQSNQPNENDTKVSELTQQLQEANLQIETLQKQNVILTTEKNGLVQKLQEANDKIATLQNENTSLTATNNEQNQKLQSANSQITDLQNKYSQLANSVINDDDFYAIAERIRQEIASTGRGTLIIETTTDDDPNAETNYFVDLSNAPASSTILTSEIVYITDTGDKYHLDGCSYLRQSKYEINRNNAISQGYTPCSRCNP